MQEEVRRVIDTQKRKGEEVQGRSRSQGRGGGH